MKPSKRFCLVEIIETKKGKGLRETVVLWTFAGKDGKIDIRGSIAPRRLTLGRIERAVDWALRSHERARQRSERARAARDISGVRQGVQDAMTLATAHKLQRRLSR